MRGKPMVMHVRSCTPDRIEIPFHIDGVGPDGGWDRSRTWVITRTTTGLRLKHDHRHADGSKDELTMYGGDTADAGTAARQTFPVDAESIALFTRTGRSVSNTNIWSVGRNDPRCFHLRLEPRGPRFPGDLRLPQTRRPAACAVGLVAFFRHCEEPQATRQSSVA